MGESRLDRALVAVAALLEQTGEVGESLASSLLTESAEKTDIESFLRLALPDCTDSRIAALASVLQMQRDISELVVIEPKHDLNNLAKAKDGRVDAIFDYLQNADFSTHGGGPDDAKMSSLFYTAFPPLLARKAVLMLDAWKRGDRVTFAELMPPLDELQIPE